MHRPYSSLLDNPPSPGPNEVVILHFAVGLIDSNSANAGIVSASSPQTIFTSEHDEAQSRSSLLPSQGVSGVVVRVGAHVTRFREGQRVAAHCQPLKIQTFPEIAYSRYSVSHDALVAAIPDFLSFTQASTLPLSISLAAAGLYQKNHLNIPLPQHFLGTTRGTILVVDGGSDVGAIVVQLAAASNVRVIATASHRDMEFVKSCGASVVVDHDSFFEGGLVAALDDAPLVGIYDTMSTKRSFAEIDAFLHETMQTCPVCVLMPPVSSLLHFSPSIVISTTINRKPHTFVREAIWEHFVPEALQSRRLRSKPTHYVVRARRDDFHGSLHAINVVPRKVSEGIRVVSFA